MDMQVLRELREWTALGFYEAMDEAWPVAFGRAFRRLYENMEIVVPADRYLLPAEPMEHCRTCETRNPWSAESMILNFNHHSGLGVNGAVAERKKEQFPQHAAFIDALVKDLQVRIVRFGGYTHSNPDIRRVVGEGFLAMRAELDHELAAVRAAGEPADELNFLTALAEYADGVATLHRRTLEAYDDAIAAATGIRKDCLNTIRQALTRGFLYPAETFLEGLAAVHFTWMLDACDSIGRFDQPLGPLWERDRADGTLDLDFARLLLDEVWQNFERFNGWNLQLGGYTPDGKDGCNQFTRECLEACRRNNVPRPNVAFRVTAQTPDEYLRLAFDVLREGSGRPALYNDDLYLRTLLETDLGLTPEDAREMGFGGCTETMIAGMSNVGSLEGELNLAAILQQTLYDGYNPVRQEQRGPHTGKFADFRTFDDFLAALKRQLQFEVDAFAAWANGELKKRFTQGDPKLYRSFFTRDCVKNHRSFEAGGARYNWSVVCFQGIATVIDSLAAIRQLVYEERKITAVELMAALRDDFRGHEALQRQLLAAPKYGNDIPAVDRTGHDVLEFVCRELSRHQPPRGGRYMGSCIIFHTFEGSGRQVAATPDGRHALTVLPDSAGAVPGRDLLGPTALLKSVTALPLRLMTGTPVVNIRLNKEMLLTADGIGKAVDLLKTYFRLGGMQLQISVVSSEAMRAAQKNPEEWQNLIVRIGGFSTYFHQLSPALQESVITRTEQCL